MSHTGLNPVIVCVPAGAGDTHSSGVVGVAPLASRLRRYELTNVAPVANNAPCRAGGLARTPDWLIVEPFMSQTAIAPLLFCSTRSVLMSLLKSPLLTTCHAAPGLANMPGLADLIAVAVTDSLQCRRKCCRRTGAAEILGRGKSRSG
jgi:hypothetical protein